MAITSDQRTALRKAMKEYVSSYQEVASLNNEIEQLEGRLAEAQGRLRLALTREEEANKDVQHIVNQIDRGHEAEVGKIIGPFLAKIAVAVVKGDAGGSEALPSV